jgi:two-component system, NtrC family, response regulator AtoC
MVSSATFPDSKRLVKPSRYIEAQVQHAIVRISESDCPVLIVGEHGVGKRSIAAQIHAQSNRSAQRFLEIRSACADADTLSRAFAENGTLYLAEVAELSLPLQDFIIDTYFHAEGPQNCRLICGSRHELLEELKSWRMREAFYYRISSIMLRISPLRCRKPDILSIADDLLTQYARQFDRPKPALGDELTGFLLEHSWPDNLFELQTAIKTFVAIGDESISLAALKAAAPGPMGNGHRKALSLKEATRAASTQIERRMISEVLAANGGNRKRAADELGISYKALLYKLKQIAEAREQGSNGVVL